MCVPDPGRPGRKAPSEKRWDWGGAELGCAEMLAEQIPSLCSSPHSAGIGRTGVLVTMETAMCLIERNLPVYPLDIVRKMRDQRAMMVQTSVSGNPIVNIVTVADAP